MEEPYRECPDFWRRWWIVLAVVTTAAATFVRWILDPWLRDDGHYSCYYIAVAVTSVLGGFRAGSLSVLLSGASAFYFFVLSMGRFDPKTAQDFIQMAIFIVVALVIAVIGEWGRQQRDQAMRESARAQFDLSERKKSEGALQRSEAQLQSIIENLYEGLVVCDGEGRLLHWNRAAGEMLQLPNIEKMSPYISLLAPVYEFITLEGAILPQEQWPIARILRGETLHRSELQLRRLRENAVRIFSYSGGFVTDANGVSLAIISFSDITEQKAAEKALHESRRDLNRAQAVAQTGSWRLDVETNELIWSDETYRIFGIPVGERVNYERFLSCVYPEDRLKVQEARDKVPAGARYDFEHRIVVHGEIRWVRERAELELDANGKICGRFGTVHDITERKANEEALAQAKAAADEARSAAEAANRAKDEFLAALSHELRTPLTPVLMLAGMMERDESISEELREDFGTIRRNIMLEAQLIDDLLDLTRIARGKLELEIAQADVHEIARHSFELLESSAKEKEIAVEFALESKQHEVMGDPVRLRQVFWNVLSNAVKFTPKQGKVSVRSRGPEAGVICFEVSDSGIGMRPEEIRRVFDAFSQGDHATEQGRRFGGLGLGLSISRKLVEMHQGRIWAESAGPGQGTTFYIQLPVIG